MPKTSVSPPSGRRRSSSKPRQRSTRLRPRLARRPPFAVVASKVRALAQRSASAAKEIKGLIATSATQGGSGVKLVGDTGQTLTRMAAKVASLVTDIAGST